MRAVEVAAATAVVVVVVAAATAVVMVVVAVGVLEALHGGRRVAGLTHVCLGCNLGQLANGRLCVMGTWRCCGCSPVEQECRIEDAL